MNYLSFNRAATAIQILGHNARAEPHGENQEKVKTLAEQQALLGKGIRAKDRNSQCPDGMLLVIGANTISRKASNVSLY